MNKTLDITYHKKQAQIFDNNTRFKVACCGRRFGKTKGSQNWLFEHAIEDEKGQESDYIAKIKKGTINIENLIKSYCKDLYTKYNSYQDVSNITGLDWRTVKKYIIK